MFHFYTPWKYRIIFGAFGFLTFWGGKEMEHWAKMGEYSKQLQKTNRMDLRIETSQKNKEKLSKTLRPKFCYLKITRFLNPRFYYIVSGYWEKNDRIYLKQEAGNNWSICGLSLQVVYPI